MLLQFYPSRLLPKPLHRSVFVVTHPPSAESELEDEESHTHQETGGDAQLKLQAPIIVEQRTYHALRDVARQTHFAIGSHLHHQPLQIGAVESHEHTRYEYEHERQVGERRYDDAQRLFQRGIFHEAGQHVVDAVKGEESNQSKAAFLSRAKVVQNEVKTK